MMPTPPAIPCHERPELFVADRMTTAMRREAIGLCRTRCPLTEFDACAKLGPVPGQAQVMAGVAYDKYAKPVVAPIVTPAEMCIGAECSELLPPVDIPNPNKRLWCSERCRDWHRQQEQKAERERESERAARAAAADAESMAGGGLLWDQASQAARIVLVTRYREHGWTDAQIARRHSITTRQVRYVRQCVGLVGLVKVNQHSRIQTAC